MSREQHVNTAGSLSCWRSVSKMNWVGGARNRVRQQNEKKIQKEFFARQKMKKPAVAQRVPGSPEGRTSKPVSFDLISLQIAQHTCSSDNATKTSSDQPGKTKVRNLDLSGKGAMDVRKWQKNDIALPMSPILNPSGLDLSNDSLYMTEDSIPKDDKRLKQRSMARKQTYAPKQHCMFDSTDEKTPIKYSPSDMNASHMSTEAIFPKGSLGQLPGAGVLERATVQPRMIARAPRKCSSLHDPQNPTDPITQAAGLACLNNELSPAKKLKQEKISIFNHKPKPCPELNSNREDMLKLWSEQIVPSNSKGYSRETPGFNYTTETPIPWAANPPAVVRAKPNVLAPSVVANRGKDRSRLANNAVKMQSNVVGNFSSFEKMMMSIKEGAPSGVQESTPIPDYQNMDVTKPLERKSWFGFVSEAPCHLANDDRQGNRPRGDEQFELVSEATNHHAKDGSRQGSRDGRASSGSSKQVFGKGFNCNEEIEEVSEDEYVNRAVKGRAPPRKEKSLYCSALEEVLELGQGLDGMESDHDLDVRTETNNTQGSVNVSIDSPADGEMQCDKGVIYCKDLEQLVQDGELPGKANLQASLVERGSSIKADCEIGRGGNFSELHRQKEPGESSFDHQADSSQTLRAHHSTTPSTTIACSKPHHVDATTSPILQAVSKASRADSQKEQSLVMSALRCIDSAIQTEPVSAEANVLRIPACNQTCTLLSDMDTQTNALSSSDTAVQTSQKPILISVPVQTPITASPGVPRTVVDTTTQTSALSAIKLNSTHQEQYQLPKPSGPGTGLPSLEEKWSQVYNQMHTLLSTANLETFEFSAGQDRGTLIKDLTSLVHVAETAKNNLVWLELLAKIECIDSTLHN